MAIIAEQKTEMQGGFKKTIDSSGAKLMFDVLQKYQYAYPVKSTVRELLSNGIDSVAEKNMARAILTGKKTVKDYYADLEGEVYTDSHFDPDYYDLNWLDKKDEVIITYYEGPHMGKDKVVIEDSGVGLGKKRLEKYFDLGFSTKRLSSKALGKFGVGAKSPISLNIDFYTVESRYNGRLYRFNVYAHTVDSIIPQYNLETGKENSFILFAEGTENEYKVYYEDTTLKNHFSITVEAKKHHKAQYIDAVKSQMLYFNGIQCRVAHEDGRIEEIDYKATILYEDDFIVMSDNKYFTKPHLLLNGVNYGYIDWSELELENKEGNIGIKVTPEEVDVNPSRESVLWTETTKKMVLNRFRNVVEIATKLINEELKETDLLKWIKTCYQISGTRWTRSTGILSRLANIVDLSNVKPKFSMDSRVEFIPSDPLPGIYKRSIEYAERKNRDTGEQKKYIKRTERLNMEAHFAKPIVLMKKDERASNRKDKYLLSLYDGFLTMHEPHGTQEEIDTSSVPEEMKSFYAKSETSAIFRQRIWELILGSELVMHYDQIQVPEWFTGSDEEEEPEVEEDTEEDIQEQKTSLQTAAERRKLEGKTIIHTPESMQLLSGNLPYSFHKMEIPIKSINDWQGTEVYYGNDKDSHLLQLVALLTRDPGYEDIFKSPVRSHADDPSNWMGLKWYRLNKHIIPNSINAYRAYYLQHYFDSSVKLVKVSQSNNRYYRDFKRVDEFFITIKNKTITMSNLLVQWNTARIIRNKLVDCAFLYNFEQFNPKYCKMYRELCEYVDKHYREVGKFVDSIVVAKDGNAAETMDKTYQDLLNHLDNVQRFQEFVNNPQATPESISALAAQLFSNADLRDGMAVDPEIMRMLKEVQEYSVACGDMLNWIPVLTGYNKAEKPRNYDKYRSEFNIDMELAFEISRYLESRNIVEKEEENYSAPPPAMVPMGELAEVPSN